MDESQNNFYKKQRIPKPPRDRRKVQEKKSNPPGPSLNNDTDAQPQRANRRQRNEPASPVTKHVADSTPSVTQAKEETTENVDFSNLKRETEEIAKLTKKFTKREIVSNWHRYSAPEGTEVSCVEPKEEDVPADFSTLIQVTASKGAHLQLKDEQDWSAASGRELKGYFALNLKLLGQSLACIPLYELLHLPKHIFTEEELRHCDGLANQTKTSTDLLQNEAETEEEPTTRTTTDFSDPEPFNILDVKKSTQKLLNIGEEPKLGFEQTSFTNFKSMEDVGFLKPADSPIKEEILNVKIEEVKEPFKEIKSNFNQTVKRSDHYHVKAEKEEAHENQLCVLSNQTSNKAQHKSDDLTEISSPLNPSSEVKKDSTVIKLEISSKESVESDTSESKEKRTNNNRRMPVQNIKIENKESVSKLDDDDDDLDFLLSLKTAIPTHSKKESKPVVKDSSFLPGKAAVVQTASKQHSELDDWLDSVLED